MLKNILRLRFINILEELTDPNVDHGLHSAPIENDYSILLIVGEHVRERVLLPQPQRQRDAGLCPVHSRCRRTAGPQMNSRPDK